MINLDEERKEKIWEEIADETKSHTTLLPNEKTIRVFSEELGISYRAASRRLEQLEKDGILESCWKLINGKYCHVYRPKA